MNDLPSQRNSPFEDPRIILLTYLDSSEDPLNAQVGQDRRLVIALLKQLRDCSEILPFMYCEMLGLRKGSSFGQTAVFLLEEIGSDNKA